MELVGLAEHAAKFDEARDYVREIGEFRRVWILAQEGAEGLHGLRDAAAHQNPGSRRERTRVE